MNKKKLAALSIISVICTTVICALYSCSSTSNKLLLAEVSENYAGIMSTKKELTLETVVFNDSKLSETTSVVNLYGKEYIGEYYRSIAYPYYMCDVDSYLCREGEKTVLSFSINRLSKQIVYYSLINYSCTTDKKNGKSYDECHRIALQKLYEYDSGIDYIEKEVEDDYIKDTYNFLFVKTIDGWETSASFSVSVNTDGTIVSFTSNTMPSFEKIGSKIKKFINIDESDFKEQVERKLSEILKGQSYQKWEIIERTLSVLKDGSPCVEYGISVFIDYAETETEPEDLVDQVEKTIAVKLIKML